MPKFNLAVLASHPVQYQAPFFRVLAKEPDIALTVYFEKNKGVDHPEFDKEFGKNIHWDIPLLEGYEHRFLRRGWNIIGELGRERYDAVLLHGWNRPLNWFVWALAPWYRASVFLRAENPMSQEYGRSGMRQATRRMILRLFFSRVSAFLYIGTENKKFYSAYGVPEKKLFFVPYAVDNERFMRAAEKFKEKKQELRERLGIPPGAVVVMEAGKLIQKKRPLDLLRAYEILCAHTPDPASRLALVFVGEGMLRLLIERRVKEKRTPNVFMTGFKNQTELPEYYAAADVFVLPSQEGETWGLVVNEAMCFSLPVVVSDMVGSGPDLVREGENGYIFPTGDCEKLAQALRALIAHPEMRVRFGARSKDVVSRYSFSQDAEGIRRALENIAT